MCVSIQNNVFQGQLPAQQFKHKPVCLFCNSKGSPAFAGDGNVSARRNLDNLVASNKSILRDINGPRPCPNGFHRIG